MAENGDVNVIPEGVEAKKRKLEADSSAPPPPTSRLLIKRLSEKARLPTRGSLYAAGYDLYRCVFETACARYLRTSLHTLREVGQLILHFFCGTHIVRRRKLCRRRVRRLSTRRYPSPSQWGAMDGLHHAVGSVCLVMQSLLSFLSLE